MTQDFNEKVPEGIHPRSEGAGAVKDVLQVPEHLVGSSLEKLFGSRGNILKAMRKIQNTDILDRASETRKQAWSLGHFSRRNLEVDALILDALVYAFFRCGCINDATDEFREMLEESLANGAAHFPKEHKP